jgi:phage terminase large subunit GpA-like protein
VQSHDDPCPIIALLPAESDVRRFAVEEIDPVFDESPALAGLIVRDRLKGRTILSNKVIVGGGSIKILSARSPRNLRAHRAKILVVDEEDAMQVTSEGDPLPLAIRRTLEYADRKIVRGSTPTDEIASTIIKAYEDSDQRVFEVPCPHCGKRFEMLWPHITWPAGEPEKAVCVCPNCSKAIDESRKTEMVWNGGCRATRPEVRGHAGFRFNALISLLPNARWGQLATEFVNATRGGPAELQPFVNTVLGQVWKQSIDDLDEESLAKHGEPFGLLVSEARGVVIPQEVLAITAGVDTQPDRYEASIWGFSETQAFCLGHFVIQGVPGNPETDAALDALLASKWKHPNGWTIGIDGTAIDSAGLNTPAVYDFCAPRLSRRIFPIVGRNGTRRLWEISKQRKADVRLCIVGVDQGKADILQRLSLKGFDPATRSNKAPGAIRFSEDLGPEYFDQLTGEKRTVRYTRGRRAIVSFVPKKSGQRVEALDCAVYAFAVRRGVYIDFAERKLRTAESEKPPEPPKVRRNDWLAR